VTSQAVFDRIVDMASKEPQTPDTPKRDSVAGAFLALLDDIQWFSSIGTGDSLSAGAMPLRRWEDWPGPEQPGVERIHYEQQAIYDSIVCEHAAHKSELLELWNTIHNKVFARAACKVPYDADADAWHGPTTAVWQAAWTSGLVGLLLYLRKAVPPLLKATMGLVPQRTLAVCVSN
jgi:hypothetical protein